MKTALQELKERLIEIGFTGVEPFIDEYIEKEKQQHEQIAIDMVNTCLNNPGVNMEEEFKKYYNEHFN